MEGVCSALDHLIELAAVGVTELGAEDVLKNRELLHRVVRYYQRRTGNAFVIVVDAVDGEIIIARTLTAHRGPRSLADSAAAGYPSLQQREVEHAGITRGNRGVVLKLAVKGCSQLGCRGVNRGGRTCDFNRHVDFTYLHLHADRGCLV